MIRIISALLILCGLATSAQALSTPQHRAMLAKKHASVLAFSPSQVGNGVCPATAPCLLAAWDPTIGVSTSGSLVTQVTGAYGTSNTLTVSNPNQFSLLSGIGPEGQNEFSFAATQFGSFGSAITASQLTVVASIDYQGSGGQSLLSRSTQAQTFLQIQNQGASVFLRNGSGAATVTVPFPNSQKTGFLPRVLVVLIDLTNHTATACLDNVCGTPVTDATNLTGTITFDRLGASASSGWASILGPTLIYSGLVSVADATRLYGFFSAWNISTFFVSSSGNDNTIIPTIGSPWQTPAKAAGVALAGQTIALRCTDIFRLTTKAGRFITTNSGTQDAFITVDGSIWCPGGVGAAQLPDGTTGASVRASLAPTCTVVSGTIYNCGTPPSDLPGVNAAGSQVASKGSGYPASSSVTLTITGGTCSDQPKLIVATDSSGKLNFVSSLFGGTGDPSDPGVCTTWPDNPVSTSTGGSGSGGTLNVNFGCGGKSHVSCVSGSECTHTFSDGTLNNYVCGYVFYIPGGTPHYFADSVCSYCGTNVVRLTHDTVSSQCAPSVGHWGYDETGACGSATTLYVNAGVALNAGDIELPVGWDQSQNFAMYPTVGVQQNSFWRWKNFASLFALYSGFDCNQAVHCDVQNIDTSLSLGDGMDLHGSPTTGACTTSSAVLHSSVLNGRWLNGVAPVSNTSFGNAWSAHDCSVGSVSRAMYIYGDEGQIQGPGGVTATFDRMLSVGLAPISVGDDDCPQFTNPCQGGYTITNSIAIAVGISPNPPQPVAFAFAHGANNRGTNQNVFPIHLNVYNTTLIGEPGNLPVGNCVNNLTNASFTSFKNDICIGFVNGIVPNPGGTGALFADHNILFNTGAPYGTGQSPGVGDLLVNPLLLNSPTDLRPAPTSPAVNAGAPNAAVGPDYNGNIRSGVNPTIGALER